MANQETSMNLRDRKCPKCGGPMIQTGAERGIVHYKCRSCGYEDSVVLPAGDNEVYWQARSQLLGRVRLGVSQWETTQWDILSRDIHRFMTNYEAARVDIYFKMAQIACMTSGFHNLNNEQYKECKQLFKLTEKIYKAYCKNPVNPHVYDDATGNAGFDDYQEYRDLYKKCRNEYRNTKLMWKAAFSILKFFIKL